MPQPVLRNPFVIDWQQSSNENSSKIIDSLKNILGPLRNKKSNGSMKKSKSKSSKLLSRESSLEEGASKKMERCSDQLKTKKEELISTKIEENANTSDEKTPFKFNFVFGTAQVLRELERKNLACAIFDRNLLKNAAISYQIGALCVNSGAVCGCLENLSNELSPVLGICTTMAFGIKLKDDKDIENIVEIIKNCLNCVQMKSIEDETKRNLLSEESKKLRYSSPTVVSVDFFASKKKKDHAKSKKSKKKLKI